MTSVTSATSVTSGAVLDRYSFVVHFITMLTKFLCIVSIVSSFGKMVFNNLKTV